MERSQLIKLSKLMSLMLRHEPGRFGLTLDAEGYAPIENVLEEVRKRFTEATRTDIEVMIQTIEPDKNRFTILSDDIRANYGHSLTDRISHAAAPPPDRLWHGTNEKALATILETGLKPMNRQYVHLTTDPQLAKRVGARRGTVVLLIVDTAAAYKSGIQFYRANDFFWLVDMMPNMFLQVARP